MLKQGDNIVTDIRLGGVQINTVYLGTEKVYPGLLRRDVGVHYDTGANTYQGWDRYNIYYYRDVLVWSNGTQTYENLRTENTLTRANAYTEADTLKSTGTSYWRSGWDKYRTDVYQTWRTREDGHADWVGAARDVSVLVQPNAYTEASTLKSVGTSYWRSGWDKYRTDTWQVLRTAFDGYQEWVGGTWGADVLVQSNAYTEARTHKSIGTSFWPSGWDKYRTDIYQTLRTAFDGYQEWVGAEEQVSVLVESNAYTLGGYYHESNTATVCVNYGAAPYSTGYHRILARNRIRFDGYQEVNDRYTESNWQIVANNVVACGYNPRQTLRLRVRAEVTGLILSIESGTWPAGLNVYLSCDYINPWDNQRTGSWSFTRPDVSYIGDIGAMYVASSCVLSPGAFGNTDILYTIDGGDHWQ